MNVSLTPKLEKFVEEKVREGTYQTASEVVREALRTLAERDQLRAVQMQHLRRELETGLEDVRRGRLADLDMKRIKAEARRELSGRKLRRVG